MLLHELRSITPFDQNLGWDELYDGTSVAGYTFYGVALMGTGIVAPDQSLAIWEIFVFKVNADGSPAATRYYPHNQIWANRLTLARP